MTYEQQTPLRIDNILLILLCNVLCYWLRAGNGILQGGAAIILREDVWIPGVTYG